jgi:hypothetical protein
MSTASMINTPSSPPADRVHDKMALANILEAPAATTSDVTINVLVDTPVLAPPSKAVKDATPAKKEAASPDNTMSETVETEESTDTMDEDAIDEDVPDEDREFICVNDETTRCRTGQYTKDLARKVISDHFGRNKACTRDIDNWPLFCRKHYQRATYNKQLWQIRKLDLIYRQFNVIEEQFPGTTYEIHFKKSEEARLNEYSRKVASGISAAEAAKGVTPSVGKHFEAPIDILRELDHDLGKNKSVDEVKEIVERILIMIKDKAIDQVPSIEFLPNLHGKATTPKKVAKIPKTPSPKKKGRNTQTPSSKGMPGRVSTKGSIKKPRQKA